MTTRMTRATRCLPLLDYLGRMARDRSEAALRPFGLRPRHLVALTMLSESGATTQRDLAAAVRLDPSNLVGLLNELEGGGLVSRRRSTADRRRHIVELTDRGHAVLGDALGALRAVEAEMLGCLDERRRDALADLLQQAIGDAIPCSIAPDGAEAAGS